MFVLLSPAKRLTTQRAPQTWTLPEQLDESTLLMETTRGLSSEDLQRLMGISEALGDLNRERFQAWAPPFTPDNAQPAALTFAGDTYVGLKAHTFKEADWDWAQEHLGILSGLYGLLRPLDLIQAYRLEMGTRLQNPRGKNLYAFWRASNTATLRKRLERAGGPVLNLASAEYFKSIDPKGLEVITPKFLERKDGKERTISFMAKQARGAMAAWVVKKRVDDVEQLKRFTGGGYRFQASRSEGGELVFSRKQPPPPGA